MKLYNVPNGSRIRLDDGTELNFHRIDGMYSYCKTDEGETVHLVAWSEVAVVKEKQNE